MDYYTIIKPYLNKFDNYKIQNDELRSCSPFRLDSRPSFSLNLTTGLWIDFGYIDEYKSRGDIYKLISLLSNKPYLEIRGMLDINEDNSILDLDKEVTFNINLDSLKSKQIKGYPNNISKYLLNRGIPEYVQKHFKTFEVNNRIGIPIYNIKSELVNIKYRLITKKVFFYENSNPLDSILFNLNTIVNKFDCTYITESEIDTMTLFRHNLPSIALMGSSINDSKIKLLKMYFKSVIIATDNDAKGKQIKRTLNNRLKDSVTVFELVFDTMYKDINDLPINEFSKVIKTRLMD